MGCSSAHPLAPHQHLWLSVVGAGRQTLKASELESYAKKEKTLKALDNTSSVLKAMVVQPEGNEHSCFSLTRAEWEQVLTLVVMPFL